MFTVAQTDFNRKTLLYYYRFKKTETYVYKRNDLTLWKIRKLISYISERYMLYKHVKLRLVTRICGREKKKHHVIRDKCVF